MKNQIEVVKWSEELSVPMTKTASHIKSQFDNYYIAQYDAAITEFAAKKKCRKKSIVEAAQVVS